MISKIYTYENNFYKTEEDIIQMYNSVCNIQLKLKTIELSIRFTFFGYGPKKNYIDVILTQGNPHHERLVREMVNVKELKQIKYELRNLKENLFINIKIPYKLQSIQAAALNSFFQTDDFDRWSEGKNSDNNFHIFAEDQLSLIPILKFIGITSAIELICAKLENYNIFDEDYLNEYFSQFFLFNQDKNNDSQLKCKCKCNDNTNSSEVNEKFNNVSLTFNNIFLILVAFFKKMISSIEEFKENTNKKLTESIEIKQRENSITKKDTIKRMEKKSTMSIKDSLLLTKSMTLNFNDEDFLISSIKETEKEKRLLQSNLTSFPFNLDGKKIEKEFTISNKFSYWNMPSLLITFSTFDKNLFIAWANNDKYIIDLYDINKQEVVQSLK